MGDLNLTPQSIKIAEESRLKKRRSIIITILVLILFIIITSMPFYIIYKTNQENKLLEVDISKLSHIANEINNLNEQKKTIQNKLRIIEIVSKEEKKWTSFINDISIITPSDISMNTVNANNDNITIQGISARQKSIAIFVANIENSKKFSDIKISEITFDEKKNGFIFNLSFKIIGPESKVK